MKLKRIGSIFLLLLLMASVVFTSGTVGPSRNTISSAEEAISKQSLNVIKEFNIPTLGSGPNAIIAGPNYTFWFTEFSAGKIGELFGMNGTFHEFTVPEAGAKPDSLAIDHSGAIWFSDQQGSGSIWSFNPATGGFRQFMTTTKNSNPLFIYVDEHNNIWFTEITAGNLGELSYPTYAESEFPTPTSGSGPAEIARQPNTSILWFTENYAGKVGMFDIVKHNFTEFTPKISLLSPVGIVLDSNSNVWVSEHGGSSVTELIVSNSTFKKFPTSLPSAFGAYPYSAPATIAIDSRGQLWFVEHYLNKIGRLDPTSRVMDEFPIPSAGFAFSVLNALDRNGNFWFTDYSTDQIGEVLANASSPVNISSLSEQTQSLNAGQSGSTQFVVRDNSSNPVSISFNATSSFTQYGQTSPQQVSFNITRLDLQPGQSAGVLASITPPGSLPSALYSVGIVAYAGNVSSVAVVFVPVQGSFSIIDFLSTNIAGISLIVVALLFLVYIFMRRKKSR